MGTYRLSPAAGEDIVTILRTSRQQFGNAARTRYRALLLASLRAIGLAPYGAPTRDRSDVAPGLRSLHLSHINKRINDHRVGAPSHILFYRVLDGETVVILRILHERMDPAIHVS